MGKRLKFKRFFVYLRDQYLLRMKTNAFYRLPVVVFATILVSCVENTLDGKIVTKEPSQVLTLESLTTRGTIPIEEDSLTVVSKQQSDVDHLMMSRIVQKNGQYVLVIKKEDALFLGISEDVYDNYVGVVNEYNTILQQSAETDIQG